MKSSLLFLFAALGVKGDVYMQSPSGSNNRLDEQNRERDNANRLMDTQNNNRGGYNVGKMEYFSGEKVPIIWTNQHGSSKYQMENSEFVVQYMCSSLLRDGTTTRTIPLKATECAQYDCDTDVRFGRHESLDSYQMCQNTERNKGLFNANQNLNGDDATKTRQNPNGNRSGLECPEERDNYPYWRPSEWVDMFYVTADTERCQEAVQQSQNVTPRTECRMPDAFFAAGGELANNFEYPLDGIACQQITMAAPDGVTYTAEFNTIPAHGVPPPACLQIEQTRANHHGNPGGKTLYELNWEVPADIPADSQCAIRLRYNITTAEYAAWESAASLNAGTDAAANSQKNKPNPNNDPAELALWETYGLTRDNVDGSFNNNNNNAAQDREYVLENNPQVDAFGQGTATDFDDGAIKMQLAVNTAQFGRTFEDRTHQFIVSARGADVPDDATLKLLTVRGKRGNIVQVYPATEYLYHPETFYIKEGEYAHIEWTGSNTNPNNNDGQGRQGTDRSNMVVQRTPQYDPVTQGYSDFTNVMTYEDGAVDTGSSGTSYPSYVKDPEGYFLPAQLQAEVIDESMGALGGMSEDVLKQLATTRLTPHDYGNMEEFDDAGTSMNLPPQKMTTKGCWNYMGTRNNNFSNRAQKGKFCVTQGDVGDFPVNSAGLEWTPDSAASSLRVWPNSVVGQQQAHVTVTTSGTSDVVEISGMELAGDGQMTVAVGFSPTALTESTLVYQEPCDTNHVANKNCDNPWIPLSFEATKNDKGQYVAMADTNQVGTFKVISKPSAAPIFALFVAVVGFVLALSYVLYKRCGHKLPGRFKRQPKTVDNTGVQATSGTQMAWASTTNGPQ